jgi:hypothetical protein
MDFRLPCWRIDVLSRLPFYYIVVCKWLYESLFLGSLVGDSLIPHSRARCFRIMSLSRCHFTHDSC